jgi:hypothetical protein
MTRYGKYAVLYLLLAGWLVGCAASTGQVRQSPVELTLSTQPAGGQVLVVETDRLVTDGQKILLPVGRYTLRPQKAGYRPKEMLLAVTAGMPSTVPVPLGRGFGRVAVTSDPAGAVVRLDGTSRGRTPLALELPEGSYRLNLVKEGYETRDLTLDLTAGADKSVETVLGKAATAGRLVIETGVPDAEILLDGQKVGQGRVELENVPFGAHQVRAVALLNAAERLTAAVEWELSAANDQPLQLRPENRERLFFGNWLSEGSALKREAARYHSQKVSNPVTLRARLDPAAVEDLAGAAGALHALMRVGDRILLFSDGKTHWFWKRNGSITREFRLSVSGLLQVKPYELPWMKEADVLKAAVRIENDPLIGLAFALHRARAERPLLDLSAKQLAVGGEVLNRTTTDGEITLLAAGGAGLDLPGEVRTIGPGLRLARIVKGQGELKLRWQKPPQRILAVSDSAMALGNLPLAKDLLIREKRLVQIAEGVQVKSVLRLTDGPDHKGWKRQEFAASGPLGGQLDLSRDEMGPHDRPGRYRRVWIYTFAGSDGLSQRQVETAYRVVDRKKDFGGDEFLRRDGLSGR